MDRDIQGNTLRDWLLALGGFRTTFLLVPAVRAGSAHASCA